MFKYLWLAIIVIAYIIFTIAGFYDLYEEVFEKSCSNCEHFWSRGGPLCIDVENRPCFKHKSLADMFDDLQDAYVFKAWICATGLFLFGASLVVYLLSLEG